MSDENVNNQLASVPAEHGVKRELAGAPDEQPDSRRTSNASAASTDTVATSASSLNPTAPEFRPESAMPITSAIEQKVKDGKTQEQMETDWDAAQESKQEAEQEVANLTVQTARDWQMVTDTIARIQNLDELKMVALAKKSDAHMGMKIIESMTCTNQAQQEMADLQTLKTQAEQDATNLQVQHAEDQRALRSAISMIQSRITS